MFEFLVPLFLIVFGWYVLLNGAKYIASRSEAKALTNDLISLINETFKNSSSDWKDYSEAITNEKNPDVYFLHNGLIQYRRINDLKLVLDSYGVTFASRKDMIDLKANLTLLPERNVKLDTSELRSFIVEKLRRGRSLHAKLIASVNKSFLEGYPPVTQPFIIRLMGVLKELALDILIISVIIIFVFILAITLAHIFVR